MTVPEKRLPTLWLKATTLSKWNDEQLDGALKSSDEIWISDFIERLNYAVEDLAPTKAGDGHLKSTADISESAKERDQTGRLPWSRAMATGAKDNDVQEGLVANPLATMSIAEFQHLVREMEAEIEAEGRKPILNLVR